MKKIIFLFSLFLSVVIYGQHEMSSFTSTGRGGATTFATDYQAIGINPANLGWPSKHEGLNYALGLSEFSYSLHSQVLSKQELRDAFSSTIKRDTSNKFTYNQKIQAAQEFANSGMAMDLDLGSFGLAFNNEKFGGIGFRINCKCVWTVSTKYQPGAP